MHSTPGDPPARGRRGPRRGREHPLRASSRCRPNRDGPVQEHDVGGRSGSGQRSAWVRRRSPVRATMSASRRTNTPTRGNRLTRRPVRSLSTTIVPVAAMPAVASTTPTMAVAATSIPQPGHRSQTCSAAESPSNRWPKRPSTRTGPRPAVASAMAAPTPSGAVRWTWPPRASKAAAQRSASGAVGEVQAGTTSGGPSTAANGRAGAGAPGPMAVRSRARKVALAVPAAVTAPPGPGPRPRPNPAAVARWPVGGPRCGPPGRRPTSGRSRPGCSRPMTTR